MDQETKEFLQGMMNQINSRFEGMESELKSFREETNNFLMVLKKDRKKSLKNLME